MLRNDRQQSATTIGDDRRQSWALDGVVATRRCVESVARPLERRRPSICAARRRCRANPPLLPPARHCCHRAAARCPSINAHRVNARRVSPPRRPTCSLMDGSTTRGGDARYAISRAD